MIPRSSLPYVLAQLRCPIYLLECPHWASLHAPEVAPAAKEMPMQDVAPVADVFPADGYLHLLEIRIQAV